VKTNRERVERGRYNLGSDKREEALNGDITFRRVKGGGIMREGLQKGS
jgi:hypothetical protein